MKKDTQKAESEKVSRFVVHNSGAKGGAPEAKADGGRLRADGY